MTNHYHVFLSYSRKDAEAAVCRWLSRRLGWMIRLPDEWEWQRAATGGDDKHVFPRGAEWDAKQEPWRANTFESHLGAVSAVGMYPAGASPTGALDMAGTVSEWCLNKFYEPEVTLSRADVVLSSDDDLDWRVLRGGGWNWNRDLARSAFRNWFLIDIPIRHSRL